ncbi:MAG TPA: TIGR01906 family membrane protein [Anaerolineaceae bacterium]|jgi:integral membrane protein (TIGR01906 family)
MKFVFMVVKILLVILIPLFIILTSIRILTNPLYPQFEYNTPGFPPDPYGFTKADRLKYAGISIDYLLNNSDISFFDQYKLADGSPMYNERELSHMRDVKILIQNAFLGWGILGILLVLAGVISWQQKNLSPFFRALSRGGWATLVIIGLILVGVVVSFNGLFTDFHRILFTGDTWLFYYSDTLIRLFPMQFWQDAFIWMGVFAIIQALIFGVFCRMIARRFIK